MNFEQAVHERSRAFERNYEAKNPAALALDYYLPEARLIAPDAPMACGHEEIAAAFQAIMATIGSCRLEAVELVQEGPIGYEIGRAVLQPMDGAAPPVDCRYLVVWSRDAAGEWRVAVDKFSFGPL
jgi:ketosteroid isomerase-like protein